MSLAILSRAHKVSPYLRRGNILFNTRNEYSTINRNGNFIKPFTVSPTSYGLEGVEVNYNRKLRLFHITSYQFSTNPNTGSTNNDLKEIQPEKKNNQLVEVKPPSFGTRVNNLLKRAGTKMMDELRHYWSGTKLLGYETYICMQLIRKITKGHTLTRREKRQLTRTAGDLLRLIPFAIIIIVPFMEFTLPFILKLFPNMLPSTFHDSLKREEQRKKELKAKIQVAKFLQEAIFEKSISKMSTKKAEEFKAFMEDVKNGVYIDNNDILKYASVFQDEFTLDQLSREQLIAMSQYMQLNTIGTNTLLRYQLTRSIEQLKADDKMIESEGIDSLTLSELQQACAARGLKATSRSKQYLKERLSEWLDLSLKRNLPVSLLILANAFKITSTTSTKDALRDAIYHLPHSVVDEIKVNVESSGDVANQLKIQLLKEENQKIREEAQEVESAKDQIELIDLQEWIKREKDIAQSSVTFTAAQLKAITEAVANVAANSSIETERKQLHDLKTLLEKRKLELQSEEDPVEEAAPTPLITSSAIPQYSDTTIDAQKILATIPQLPEVLPQPVQSEETKEKKRVEEEKEKEKEKEMEKEKESIAKISDRLEKYVQDLQETVDKNYSIMMSLDKNGDGMVDLAEIQEAAKQYKQQLPEELVNHVIATLDADSDGKIKLEDLQKFAEKYVIKTKTPVGDSPAAITQEESPK